MSRINNKGFSLIGMIVTVAIMVALMAMYLPSTMENGQSMENMTELKTTASTIYNAAQIYVSTQLAAGNTFQPNETIPSEKFTSGLDTSNLKTIEIKLDNKGSAVKYVFIETNAGTKYDFPVGSSGKVD